MSEQLDLLSSGPALRDAGVARVDANADEAWKQRADAVIRHLAAVTFRTGGHFCMEDVRRWVGSEPHHFNAWGARVLAAKRHGLIEVVGESTATRPEAHATRMRHYRGTATAATPL